MTANCKCNSNFLEGKIIETQVKNEQSETLNFKTLKKHLFQVYWILILKLFFVII